MDEEAGMDALFSHVIFDPETDTEEVEETLITFSLCSDPRWARDINHHPPLQAQTLP